MSDAVATRPMRRADRVALYAAAAIFAIFDLVVLWQAVHPQVPAIYRAYYIDRTTTCLDQPGAGTYTLGAEISFRSGGERHAKPVMVCGWEGPVGNGIHSVGESSRLFFALPPGTTGELDVMLEMEAVKLGDLAGMPVVLEANGTRVGEAVAVPGRPTRATFTIPPGVVGQAGSLDLELKFPRAVLVDPQDANTRKRAIMLTAGQVSLHRPYG